MAVIAAPITIERFREMPNPLTGMAVARVWLGYANALFIEFGRLHFEPSPVRRLKSGLRLKSRHLTGQASLMVDSDWRLEHKARIICSRRDSEWSVHSTTRRVIGRVVRAVEPVLCGPELTVEISGDFHFHTFSNYESPKWALFLRDIEKFPRDPRWHSVDHSLWLSTGASGRLVMEIGHQLGGKASP